MAKKAGCQRDDPWSEETPPMARAVPDSLSLLPCPSSSRLSLTLCPSRGWAEHNSTILSSTPGTECCPWAQLLLLGQDPLDLWSSGGSRASPSHQPDPESCSGQGISGAGGAPAVLDKIRGPRPCTVLPSAQGQGRGVTNTPGGTNAAPPSAQVQKSWG